MGTHVAVFVNHSPVRQHTVMQILMERCQSVTSLLVARDVHGCAPVHWAAYTGDMVGLKLLEGFNADLAATDAQD
eukprot:1457891-Amphidinium_carterae.3